MNVSLTARWERFLSEAIQTGRYETARDVVEEGLRLVQERDRKLAILKETIRQSLEEGGEHSDDEVAAAIERKTAEMAGKGH